MAPLTYSARHPPLSFIADAGSAFSVARRVPRARLTPVVWQRVRRDADFGCEFEIAGEGEFNEPGGVAGFGFRDLRAKCAIWLREKR